MSIKSEAQSKPQYQDLLDRLEQFPTLPHVVMKVSQLINDPKSSSRDIADILKKDQVLTSKVLKLINSSYYSIPGGVTDVQRALAFLGFNTIAQLVLSVSVFTLFNAESKADGFSMTTFWRHALGVAVCSEFLAKKIKYSKPNEAFTCGLLHDLGKLVLHAIDPNEFNKIIAEAQKRKTSYLHIENVFEIPSHSYLGEVIATKWNLPESIGLSIRYHHQNISNVSTITENNKKLIHIVQLSNAICNKNQIGHSGNYFETKISSDLLKPIGFALSDLEPIEISVKKEIERAGALLNAYR